MSHWTADITYDFSIHLIFKLRYFKHLILNLTYIELLGTIAVTNEQGGDTASTWIVKLEVHAERQVSS